MAKCVLFQAAALLLVFIAGGQGQPPVRPSPVRPRPPQTRPPVILPDPTPVPPPPSRNCLEVFRSCSADPPCAALYAAFERECAMERNCSKPANCSRECRQTMSALAAHQLGADFFPFCDCGSIPLISDACRASRDCLRANCFPPPGECLRTICSSQEVVYGLLQAM